MATVSTGPAAPCSQGNGATLLPERAWPLLSFPEEPLMAVHGLCLSPSHYK